MMGGLPCRGVISVRELVALRRVAGGREGPAWRWSAGTARTSRASSTRRLIRRASKAEIKNESRIGFHPSGLVAQAQHEMGAAIAGRAPEARCAAIYSIIRVASVAVPSRVVRRQPVDLIGKCVVHEELAGELITFRRAVEGANFRVDMYRPSLIPTRIDSDEVYVAVAIRRLIAAEESAASRVLRGYVGVNTCCVAVPYVHVRSGERHGLQSTS
jgi:hypothetical protein